MYATPTTVQKLKLFMAIFTLSSFVLYGSAGASAPYSDANTLARVQLSALVVSLVISMFVPIVTGLLTKASLSGWVKGLITLILNAIQALIVQNTMADGTAVIDKSTFIAWAFSFGMSVAMYLGIYKGANLTSNPGGKLAPSKGLGPK